MTEASEHDYGIITEEKARVAHPRMWKVVMFNDDYTTRDFVVEVLRSIFHHDEAASTRIMLRIHRQGSGVAGVYTHEVAETKVRIVEMLAREREFPLQLTLQPEQGGE